MEIVHSDNQLKRYVREAVIVSGDNPVLIDQYLRDAIEVDVDALSDGNDVFVAGIMEHIEEAGIHSGDSACALPPYSLSDKIVQEIEVQTIKLAKALKVKGLMNVQFAVQGDEIYILEANPRASRTAPFVAKAVNIPIAGIAAKLQAGEKLVSFDLKPKKLNHVAVKEAVFPFARFAGIDPILGPEMKSTGEVMGLDSDFAQAFLKSQIGAGMALPKSGTVFISVKDSDKAHLVELVRAGERIYRGGIPDRQIAVCAACHGPTGSGIPAQYPRLSGQHAEYTRTQLNTLRAGARNNNAQMTGVAAKMNDMEIKAVSDYIAGLR